MSHHYHHHEVRGTSSRALIGSYVGRKLFLSRTLRPKPSLAHLRRVGFPVLEYVAFDGWTVFLDGHAGPSTSFLNNIAPTRPSQGATPSSPRKARSPQGASRTLLLLHCPTFGVPPNMSPSCQNLMHTSEYPKPSRPCVKPAFCHREARPEHLQTQPTAPQVHRRRLHIHIKRQAMIKSQKRTLVVANDCSHALQGNCCREYSMAVREQQGSGCVTTHLQFEAPCLYWDVLGHA